MTTTTSRPPDRPSSPRNDVPNPFESNFHCEAPDFSIEAYIKKEIEAIFYANKKMDLQAKIEVYWKATEQKTLQLTSCSIVYSIIRDTVERIAWKLRQLVDNSYTILTQHKRSWSKMSTTSVSWSKNWLKFKQETDQPYLLFVYPPLANYYNMLYKHLCDSAKEVYSLWKIMYECIPVKDLNCETFQQSISELILDIFTIPTKTFEPKRMLPVISLASKCQFVKAEVQNSCKRMEYTRFQEDQMAKNLIEANNRRLRTLGLNLQQFASLNRHNNDCTLNNCSKRLDRSKIDHRFLSELSKLYTEPDRQSETHLAKNQLQLQPVATLFKHQQMSLGPQITTELVDTFEGNAELIYELQDTSSQEDDLHTYYASGNSSNKDELIEENQEIQVQLYPLQDRLKEIQASAKLSSSTGIDETNDNNDLSAIKNYQFENPPDFVLQDDLNSSDPYENQEKHDQMNFQISQKYITKIENGKKYTHEIKVIKKQNYEEHHITFNVDKTKKKIAKQHDRHPKDRSKCYMESEKEKLQKYRKELEKEKEDLLKEVQRFVKEKEKDEHIYKLINDKLACKNSRRPKNQYKYPQQLKSYDFNRCRPQLLQDQGDLILTKEQIAERIQSQKYIGLKVNQPQSQDNQLLEDKNLKIQSNGQENKQDKASILKMSKRQQKHRKKVERQINEIRDQDKARVLIKQQPKQIISEEEIELNHFLDNLNVTKSNRVPCHIEESRLQRWKMKINIIRSKSIKECLISEPAKPQQATGKSSKKKKKNRN